MKVDGQFLESRADPAELLEPADALFDHRAPAVSLTIKLYPVVLASGWPRAVARPRLPQSRTCAH